MADLVGPDERVEVSAGSARWLRWVWPLLAIVAVIALLVSLGGTKNEPIDEVSVEEVVEIPATSEPERPTEWELGEIRVFESIDGGFALGAPPGTVFGFSDGESGGRVIDLSDGSLLRFRELSPMVILDDYVVGVSNETSSNLAVARSFAVFNRKTGDIYVQPEMGYISEIAPAERSDEVWILTLSSEGSTVSLVSLTDRGGTLASFTTEDTVTLHGAHSVAPLMTAGSSGVYRLSEDGPEFLHQGRVLGRSECRVVTVSCDDSYHCPVLVEGGAAGMGIDQLGTLPNFDQAPVVGGTQAAYLHGEGAIRVIVLDNASSHSHEIRDDSSGVDMVWAGSILVIYDGSTLELLETQTLVSVRLGPSSALRPAQLISGPPAP